MRALLLALSLAPVTVSAQPSCTDWLVSGLRTIEQGNGIRVTANFSQEGDEIRGTASWTLIVTKS